MISSELQRIEFDLERYGPLTRTESLIEAMAIQAHEVSGQYHRHDVALLAEALGSIGMNLLDLPEQELEELAAVEETIERRYGINEFDEGDEE